MSWRQGDGPSTGMRETVPVALERPLRGWVAETLDEMGIAARWMADRVLLRLNLTVPNHETDDWDFSGRDESAFIGFLTDGTSVEVLVDVVDAVLDLLPHADDFVRNPSSGRGLPYGVPRPPGRGAGGIYPKPETVTEQRGELVRLLGDAQSALRMRADGRGLERRPVIGAEVAFGEAVRSAEGADEVGSAAAHLREAWGCVYALHPDADKGYSEAVKAVEAAAHSVLLPTDSKATLGGMRRQLESTLSRFSLAIRGPDGQGNATPLLACVSLLWEGQLSRHGSMKPTPPQTLEEATMAVHLAAMLVQWFTSGAVRKA